MYKGVAPQIDLSSVRYDVSRDGSADKVYGRGTPADTVVFVNGYDL